MPNDAARPTQPALDPGVQRFVAEVTSAFARFPPLDTVSHGEARRIAEIVREPWRQGGPRMYATREYSVPAAGTRLRIRVYDPGPPGLKPALIYLHGGGWTLFSIDTHDRVMREYAARAGITVVGVDYSLSPENKFPQALGETVAVVDWLCAEAAGIGVDGSRLAIGGDSAGGNLAMAACLSLRDAGRAGQIGGMLLNYGGFDVECSETAVREFGGDDNMLNYAEVRLFWGNYLRGPDDAENPLACPLRARLGGLPPAFLTIPECDILSEQNLLMASRLRAAGVAVETGFYRGATHSFLEAVSVSELADRALADGSRWLAATLRAGQ